MEKILATYAAGEIKTFEITGNYFELVQAKDPVDIYLQDRNGTNLAFLKAAEASYYMKLHPAQYQRIQVKSDTAQDVAFIRADGECGTRNMAGIIRVVDEDVAGATQRKSFVAAAIDKVDMAAKRFAKVAIWNKSADKSLAISKIIMQTGIHQNSTLANLSGNLALHIESAGSGGSSKFGWAGARLADSLAVSFDVSGSVTNSEVTDSAAILQTKHFPDAFGGQEYDLSRNPIILKAGQLLVLTKSFDDPAITGGELYLKAMFMGKAIEKNIA